MPRIVSSHQMLIQGLVVACLLPRSESLAFVREDSASNVTAARAAAREKLAAARALFRAKMNESGLRAADLPDWAFPAKQRDSDFDNFVVGHKWNCRETAATITEPSWSLVDAIWKVTSLCDANTDNCKMAKAEARLGMAEAALGAAGYLLDIPNDCLGFTCAYRGNKEDSDWVDPEMRIVTLYSAVEDIAGAASGVAAAGLSTVLQCDKKQGDSLIDPLSNPLEVLPWIHPTMLSYLPLPWELRSIAQLWVTREEADIAWQRAEKVLSIFESIAATVQSTAEARMGYYNETDGKQSASAEAGCVAAVSHMAASTLALLGGFAKLKACWDGEREVQQSRDSFSVETEVEVEECHIETGALDDMAYYNSCYGLARQYLAFGNLKESARNYDGKWKEKRDKASNCYKNCCTVSTFMKESLLNSMKKTDWCKKKPVKQWTTVEGWFDE